MGISRDHIMWKILVMLFSREVLRDLANFNGVPLLQGSLYTMGNNNNILREPLRDLGKSQWSSFIWVVYEGITVRFGKISMEFLHLGGLMMESLRDLGKSQWSSFIWGFYMGITARFGKISMEFLHLGVYKGIKQLSQRCR